MYTLVEELSNCSVFFLGFQDFLIYLAKHFLALLIFPYYDFSTTFLQEQCKLNSLISFFIIARSKPLFTTITQVKIYFSLIAKSKPLFITITQVKIYFSLIRILKSKKKK